MSLGCAVISCNRKEPSNRMGSFGSVFLLFIKVNKKNT